MPKTWALIKRGVCVNTIVADDEFIATLTGYDEIVDMTDRTKGGVGMFYEDGEFWTAEELIAKEAQE